MKLLAKFNLLFLIVFGIGLAVTAYVSSTFLREQAKREILAQARLMMETTLSTRRYTATQIRPLLNKHADQRKVFLPQVVPAYSATEVFNSFHERYPAYSYKEATLNPTNLRDRAVDWEADVVNSFRSGKETREFIGERTAAGGQSLFLAMPLRVTGPECLECHSVPKAAPAAMIAQYGGNNGFGWKNGEIIGAQIISVPESVPVEIADRALRTLLLYLGVIAVASLLVLDGLLVVTVIRPVRKLSRMADEISQGNTSVQELPITGKDEISVLASSFNRMYRSLERAMRMLDADPPS